MLRKHREGQKYSAIIFTYALSTDLRFRFFAMLKNLHGEVDEGFYALETADRFFLPTKDS